ncbi:hypothetical protein AB0B10_25880 [Micromonospora arborensis]|uniref:hypothetical protein n=1 Tax=Micromonospora arborensis TaxID=2116518 RepID=UPI0033CB74B3
MLDDAPVKDAVGVLILLALADEANDDGTDSCPYKDKLIARARKSERTVQTYLRKLYQARLIDFGDQTVAQRRYGKQPGHAPRAWNLNLEATWNNVPAPRTEEEMEFYGRMMTSGRMTGGVQAPAPQTDGVQISHPTSDQRKQRETGVQAPAPQTDGVQISHPTSDQRKQPNRPTDGVQTSAPFPSVSSTKREKTPPPTSSTAPAATGDGQEGVDDSFGLENQETEADIKATSFWPKLTDWESQLAAECLNIDPLWSPRMLRKTLGSRTIREITSRSPDLVRRAFLLGAQDQETTTPVRMWHVEFCPHWRHALAQMEAERAATAGEVDAVQQPTPPRPTPPRTGPCRTCKGRRFTVTEIVITPVATSSNPNPRPYIDERPTPCPSCNPQSLTFVRQTARGASSDDAESAGVPPEPSGSEARPGRGMPSSTSSMRDDVPVRNLVTA